MRHCLPYGQYAVHVDSNKGRRLSSARDALGEESQEEIGIMKLARFSASSKAPRLGLVVDGSIIDVQEDIDGITDMRELLDRMDGFLPALRQAGIRTPSHGLGEVKLLAPIARPGKILALGLNYRDHAAEANMALPEIQTWFSKMTTAVNGPRDPIDLPRVSSKLDYEAELAFVIGRRVRHATREQARAAIFGYCCANDVSVRDWQLRSSQFVVGKSFDTHCPFGPWIVTADEIPDPQSLRIRCSVNGECRQDSNTAEMVFDVYSMVEHLSQAMTLEPGDLILTGTPAGVGAVSKPPRYLKAGDVVRVEIERIGHIENTVVVEAA